MNRRIIIAPVLAVIAIGASFGIGHAQAATVPAHRCTLEVSLNEDETFLGERAILDGRVVAPYWRVVGPARQGRVFIDQERAGRLTYGTGWAPGMAGTTCHVKVV